MRMKSMTLLFLLALNALVQSAFAQGKSVLAEVDARAAAMEMMAQAEAQFECKLEEYSMEELGQGPDIYLFRLDVAGDECSNALVYLTNLALRNDKLLFRKSEKANSPNDDIPIVPSVGPNEALIIPSFAPNQVLIHEVNPPVDLKDDEQD